MINDPQQPPVMNDEYVLDSEKYEEKQGIRYKKTRLYNFGMELSVPANYQTILDDGSYHYFIYRNDDELDHVEISITEVFNSDISPFLLTNIVENGEDWLKNCLRYHHTTGRIYNINNYFKLSTSGEREILLGDKDVYVDTAPTSAPWRDFIEIEDISNMYGAFEVRKNLIGERLSTSIKLGGQGSGSAFINSLFVPHNNKEYIITVLSPEPSRELNDKIFNEVISSISFFDVPTTLSNTTYAQSDILGPTLVLPRGWEDYSIERLFSTIADLNSDSKTYGMEISLLQIHNDNPVDTILYAIPDGDKIASGELYMDNFDNNNQFGILEVSNFISSIDSLPDTTTRYPAVIGYKVINVDSVNYVVFVMGSDSQAEYVKSIIKTIH